MYWVGHQIHHNGNSGTVGIAYTTAVCTGNGYSVIEDIGFDTFKVAAHELGHSLGAGHDVKTGDCSSAKKHVMSPSVGNKYEESWTFSTCSVSDFKNNLATKSCVKNKVNKGMRLSRRTQPGRRYDVDWQCRWAYYNYSIMYSCFGDNVRESDCSRGMFCKTSKNSLSCSSNTLPLNGTPCGTGKRCIQGKCIKAK